MNLLSGEDLQWVSRVCCFLCDISLRCIIIRVSDFPQKQPQYIAIYRLLIAALFSASHHYNHNGRKIKNLPVTVILLFYQILR